MTTGLGVQRLILPATTPALTTVPHAIPYQGSKRALARAIIPLLPAGTTTLVEPFAGSAAVALAARHLGAASGAVLSDINEPLMNLWRRILRDPSGLADDYAALWHAQLDDPRAYYIRVRSRFNATGEPHLLLYLLSRCVKAAVRYSRTGAFNQSADHRRLGARPELTRDRLAAVASALAGATVRTGDYGPLLVEADRSAVVYLDPPYQGVTNVRDHRYVRGLDRAELEAALGEAVGREVSFLVSYDVVTESKQYGEKLSDHLGLTHLHVVAGRSTQATLHGRSRITVESLYLSPALVDRLGGPDRLPLTAGNRPERKQPPWRAAAGMPGTMGP